jgi:hypothetical protein
MRRRRLIVVVTVMTILTGVASYFLLRGDVWVEGDFPELRPAGDAPAGYAWNFRDGPDFYTWILEDNEKAGDLTRSGIGIYFGHHPNLSTAKKTTSRIEGRAFSKKVMWMIETNDDPKEGWTRRDTLLRYDHGKGYGTILLHVWVWGQTEEQMASLLGLVENQKFVIHQRRALKAEPDATLNPEGGK